MSLLDITITDWMNMQRQLDRIGATLERIEQRLPPPPVAYTLKINGQPPCQHVWREDSHSTAVQSVCAICGAIKVGRP